MNRWLLCLIIAVAYLAYRAQPVGIPAVIPVSIRTPFPAVTSKAAALRPDHRKALSETYSVLSRSVSADPQEDRVFPDTAAVRRAHRAALLCVYKGVLEGVEGAAPGLREALEGSLNARIGDGDIPMNPTLQSDTAKAFADLAASLE
jgi:hypothetical protein